MEFSTKSSTNHRIPRSITRRRSSKRKRAQSSATANGRNGFLNYCFEPIRADSTPQLNNQKQIERDFFQSLSNLCQLYNFQVPQVDDHIYPLNVTVAFKDIEKKLAQFDKDLGIAIIEDKNRTATIITFKSFNTGYTLYYVPIRPLWDLLKDRKRQRTAELVLSIFCYLYRVNNIPFYTDSSSYISYVHEMLSEWYISDEECEEDTTDEFLDIIETANYCGKIIKRKMKNPYHLKVLEERIQRYNPESAAEIRLQQIAERILTTLNTTKRGIQDSLYPNLIYPGEDERIYPDYYLSFVWDIEDDLNDQVMGFINTDLQEKVIVDAPLSIQAFDTPQERTTHDLTFEESFFLLISDLVDTLTELA